MPSLELKNTIYEAVIQVVPKSPIPIKNVGNAIGKAMADSITRTPHFHSLHFENNHTSKKFCFSHFCQRPTNGFYEKGIAYSFKCRSSNLMFLNELKDILDGSKNSLFYFLEVFINTVDYTTNTYKTSSPVIMIRPSGSNEKYFANNFSLLEYKTVLQNKMVKYYKRSLSNDKEIKASLLDSDFLADIKLLTSYPVCISFKNKSMLGYRVEMTFKEDSFAQEMKTFCLQFGLGEKTTSVGAGFLEPVVPSKGWK